MREPPILRRSGTTGQSTESGIQGRLVHCIPTRGFDLPTFVGVSRGRERRAGPRRTYDSSKGPHLRVFRTYVSGKTA